MAADKAGRAGRRGPSLRRTVMVDTFRGTPRIRKWPKKRGKNLHPKTLKQMEWFSQANKLCRYIDPAQLAIAKRVTAGTPLMPRDILLMAMSGRLYSVELEGRGEIYPVAAINDVSRSLDVIAQKPGDMMARGPTFWQRITPGPAGQVLTSVGPNDAPRFEPSPALRPRPIMRGLAWNDLTGSSSIRATKGSIFTPLHDFTLWGIAAMHSFQVGGHTYRCDAYEVDDPLTNPEVLAVMARGEPRTIATEVPGVFVNEFETAPRLLAGHHYLLTLIRTDAGPEGVCRLFFSAENNVGVTMPGTLWPRAFTKDKIGLDVGDTPTEFNEDTYCVFPYA